MLEVPIVLGADWFWPSMSNLTSFQNPVYLHHLSILTYLWGVHKTVVSWTIPHPKWLRTYTDSYIFADRIVLWTMKQFNCIISETIAGFRFKAPPYHSMCRGSAPHRLDDWRWILHAAIGFRQIIHIPHAGILYTNNRQSPKHQQNSAH